MKVHNYANDYAFQAKQQLEEKVAQAAVENQATQASEVVNNPEKPEENAGSEVQTRGEGDMAESGEKAEIPVSEKEKESQKKKKK